MHNKKLYRSKTDKKIGGVLGGLAEYFNIDSTLLRVIFVFIVFFSGIFPGVLAYLFVWLIMPEPPKGPEQQQR